ncbi:hypothetical protein AB6A40_002428 [Gnathostoma spinigerum]|uniref:C2H2-type domain-containing protein n=1 Tax=Gnathostoma spinigerum TaxID=75299 RepID=A0ABD6E6K0_9BILA
MTSDSVEAGCSEVYEDVYPSAEELLMENSMPPLCNVCGRSFSNVNALRMHLVKSHDIVESAADSRLRHRSSNSEKGLSRKFHCPFMNCRCTRLNISFKSFKLLRQHALKVHNEKSLKCSLCNMAEFSLARDLKYHQRWRCLKRDSADKVVHEKLVKRHCNSPRPNKPVTEKTNAKNQMGLSSAKNKIKEREKVLPQKFLIVHRVIPLSLLSRSKFVPILPRTQHQRCNCGKSSVTTAKSSTQTDSVLQSDDIIDPLFQSTLDGSIIGNETSLSHQSISLISPGFSHVSSQASFPLMQIDVPVYETSDFHCQTCLPIGVESGTQIYPNDAVLHNAGSSERAVMTDSFVHGGDNSDTFGGFVSVATSTRQVESSVDSLDIDELLRHMETQTPGLFFNDALTQTADDLLNTCDPEWSAL